MQEELYHSAVGQATAAAASLLGGPAVLSLAFYEIYNGGCYDLLAGRAPFKVMEDGAGAVQVVGLSEAELPSAALAALAVAAELIETGRSARVTGANAIHDGSSRSHAVLRLTLRVGSGPTVATITLVDLAGSEKVGDQSPAPRPLHPPPLHPRPL